MYNKLFEIIQAIDKYIEKQTQNDKKFEIELMYRNEFQPRKIPCRYKHNAKNYP